MAETQRFELWEPVKVRILSKDLVSATHPRLQKMAEDMLNFDVFHHSLNFFAKCRTLKESGACEHKAVKSRLQS